MIRRIHCETCGVPPCNPADQYDGWHQRTVALTARKPPEHYVEETVIEPGKSPKVTRTDLPTLVCDLCGQPIPDGTRCVAITMWRGTEPEPWEGNYGEPITT